MRLTIVGCAGSYPSATSAASCYLVEAEGFRLVVDLGSGALGALARHTDLDTVDAVLVTHLHPDHYIDLCAYHVARRYHPAGPRPVLPLHAPAGAAARLVAAYGSDTAPGIGASYDHRPLTPGRLGIGPFAVTVERMNHPVETFGVRLEHAGATLAYSADTGRSDALVALARDADLLLCEASFVEGADNPPDLHLTGKEAAEHAARAGAGRLLLTHLVAWNDPARVLADAAGFPGPVELAAAGSTRLVGETVGAGR